jgi:hypothetical protein
LRARGCSVVRVSGATGAGLDALRLAMLRAIEAVEAQAAPAEAAR